MRRSLFLCCSAVLVLNGCFTPMKTSDGHLRDQPAAAPTINIPPTVQAPAIPPPKPSAKTETYSVVVDRVPAQQLLFALARDAKINVDVHPGITGTVTLNAIDQTLPQILSRISKQIDMRYEFDGPNLTIMPDSPYLRVYKVDYVNMQRESRGIVSVSGSILSAGATTGTGAGGAGGGQSSSSSNSNASIISVQNVSINRFWETLEKNIEAILRETDKIIPTTTQSPAVPGAATAAPVSVTYREAASVIVNADVGLITVRATARQHEKIQEFLDQVMSRAKRQVLIEATIVEVRLSNAYQQGIDWGIFSGSAGFQLLQGNLFSSQARPPVPPLLGSVPAPSLGVIQYRSQDFKASVQLLETFGTLRVLSSPRISVINNQTAVLKVVDNLVYFIVESSASQAENNVVSSINTTPQSVSVGFIMNVTPQIDDSGTIILNVKPTISRKIDDAIDPNPLLKNPCLGNAVSCPEAAIESKIPVIQQRELESVLRLRSGQVAVMGGLIQDELRDNENTLPGVSRIPLLSDLFGNKDQASGKTELVIFLRPVVVEDPSLDGDYQNYRNFLPKADFMEQPNPGKPRQLSTFGASTE